MSDAAGPATRAPNSAARAAPVVATPTAVEGFGPDDTYRRSLIYSGMFGLVIASIGMAMVGRRRRDW